MGRLLVPRMLAVGSFVGAETALRTTSRCLLTVAERTPPLVATGLRATAGGAQAQAEFRDELIALARETADVSWRELRSGLESFDARTRPREARPANGRLYRVKP